MSPLFSLTTIDSSSARLVNKSDKAKKPDEITKSEKKIREAAEGFERTLLRQLLSVARSTNINSPEPKSSTSMAYLQMMDDRLAGKPSITDNGKENSLIRVDSGANLDQVVKALNMLGATPQDLISILQALRAAGALRAELEVI